VRSVCFWGSTELVHLVGVLISLEKNFYRLPFTPPLSGSPYRSFTRRRQIKGRSGLLHPRRGLRMSSAPAPCQPPGRCRGEAAPPPHRTRRGGRMLDGKEARTTPKGACWRRSRRGGHGCGGCRRPWTRGKSELEAAGDGFFPELEPAAPPKIPPEGCTSALLSAAPLRLPSAGGQHEEVPSRRSSSACRAPSPEPRARRRWRRRCRHRRVSRILVVLALVRRRPPRIRWIPIPLELRPPDRPQPRRAGEGGARPPHRDTPHEPLAAVLPGATPAAVSTSQRWGGRPPPARHLVGCRGEARRNERGGGRGRWWGDKEG
jgi:hypothetical protein